MLNESKFETSFAAPESYHDKNDCAERMYYRRKIRAELKLGMINHTKISKEDKQDRKIMEYIIRDYYSKSHSCTPEPKFHDEDAIAADIIYKVLNKPSKQDKKNSKRNIEVAPHKARLDIPGGEGGSKKNILKQNMSKTCKIIDSSKDIHQSKNHNINQPCRAKFYCKSETSLVSAENKENEGNLMSFARMFSKEANGNNCHNDDKITEGTGANIIKMISEHHKDPNKMVSFTRTVIKADFNNANGYVHKDQLNIYKKQFEINAHNLEIKGAEIFDTKDEKNQMIESWQIGLLKNKKYDLLKFTDDLEYTESQKNLHSEKTRAKRLEKEEYVDKKKTKADQNDKNPKGKDLDILAKKTEEVKAQEEISQEEKDAKFRNLQNKVNDPFEKLYTKTINYLEANPISNTQNGIDLESSSSVSCRKTQNRFDLESSNSVSCLKTKKESNSKEDTQKKPLEISELFNPLNSDSISQHRLESPRHRLENIETSNRKLSSFGSCNSVLPRRTCYLGFERSCCVKTRNIESFKFQKEDFQDRNESSPLTKKSEYSKEKLVYSKNHKFVYIPNNLHKENFKTSENIKDQKEDANEHCHDMFGNFINQNLDATVVPDKIINIKSQSIQYPNKWRSTSTRHKKAIGLLTERSNPNIYNKKIRNSTIEKFSQNQSNRTDFPWVQNTNNSGLSKLPKTKKSYAETNNYHMISMISPAKTYVKKITNKDYNKRPSKIENLITTIRKFSETSRKTIDDNQNFELPTNSGKYQLSEAFKNNNESALMKKKTIFPKFVKHIGKPLQDLKTIRSEFNKRMIEEEINNNLILDNTIKTQRFDNVNKNEIRNPVSQMIIKHAAATEFSHKVDFNDDRSPLKSVKRINKKACEMKRYPSVLKSERKADYE